jgi:hypothetical protein
MVHLHCRWEGVFVLLEGKGGGVAKATPLPFSFRRLCAAKGKGKGGGGGKKHHLCFVLFREFVLTAQPVVNRQTHVPPVHVVYACHVPLIAQRSAQRRKHANLLVHIPVVNLQSLVLDRV